VLPLFKYIKIEKKVILNCNDLTDPNLLFILYIHLIIALTICEIFLSNLG